MPNTGDPVLMDIPIKGVYKYKSMSLEIGRVLGTNKPTSVYRGMYAGWSLPIFNNDDEELYACECVPPDWDGSSDFAIHIGCWLDTANSGKRFKLRLSYSSHSDGEVVPDTATDVDVETETGDAAQYAYYFVEFTVPAGDVSSDDVFGVRLRRIAASSDEIAGEVVVEGFRMRYVSNLIGGIT